MIKNEKYRLAEYKIIVGEDGYIRWEAHSGFCSAKIGHCFVQGSILFITPWKTSEVNGFLKGDFIDQLNLLPKWEKTNHYCTSFVLVKCKAGQTTKPPLTNRKISNFKTMEDVSYRLGQFEIIEKMDGKLTWKSYSGHKAMKLGKAFVHGNILFLVHGESETTDIIKSDFLEHLVLLPLWEKTFYFCRQYSLYSCSTNTTCCDLGENNPYTNRGKHTVGVKKISPTVEPTFNPQTTDRAFTKNHLKDISPFCTMLVLIIFKVLFRFGRAVFKLLKLYIDKCVSHWKKKNVFGKS